MKKSVKRKVKSRRVRLNRIESWTIIRLQGVLRDWITDGWALLAHEHHFHAHRGAWEVADDDEDVVKECIIFGNDGFATDVRARKEVVTLVRRLEDLGIKILGFGLSPNGYSWALRIAHNNYDLPHALVWDVWFSNVCGMKSNPVASELEMALAEFKKVA